VSEAAALRRMPSRTAPSPERALACVLGDVDLLRALGLAGIRCAVAAAPGVPSRYSRFARVVLDWPDAGEQPALLLGLLERFGAAQPEPPVLFYAEDRDLLLVSRYRERLQRHFRFVVPDAALVEALVDKSRFQVLAQRLDLPVPAARALDPRTDPVPLDLRYPVALKPRVRSGERWDPIARGAKALRVETPGTLVTLWPRLAVAGIPVLLQELIPGPETRVESYHVYVDDRGAVVAEFTGRKIRTWPPAYGDSTALIVTDAPDVTLLGREVVGRLELRGVAKLDFKRGPDGRLYLLEVNPRFTLWHHLGARAGVNVPALVYGDLLGLPRSRVTKARAGVRWCRPWRDVAAARAAGVSLLRWLPWALSCEAKRVVAWDDPMPLLGALFWRGVSRLRDLGRGPRA
jgi:predicted ATP-grasp superfamily ATP-dependent carboligase